MPGGSATTTLAAVVADLWPGRFDPEALHPDAPVGAGGLELDSIEVVELVFACEERTGIEASEAVAATEGLTLGGLAVHFGL